MSANPIGVSGHPNASAIGFAMAIVSGVSMNDLASGGAIAFWPFTVSRWSTIAPQPRAAGDQMTGCGPLTLGSGHPLDSNVAAAPDAFFSMRAKTHWPFTFDPGSRLKSLAS
jgi:hypothetical protein